MAFCRYRQNRDELRRWHYTVSLHTVIPEIPRGPVITKGTHTPKFMAGLLAQFSRRNCRGDRSNRRYQFVQLNLKAFVSYAQARLREVVFKNITIGLY